MKNLYQLFVCFLCLSFLPWQRIHAQSVFSEAFGSVSSTTWRNGSPVAIPSSIWTYHGGNTNHAARINGGRMELTNKRSSTGVHSQGMAYVACGGSGSQFTSGYNSTLKNNTGAVTWTFNFRKDASGDGGFNCTSSSQQNYRTTGMAFILATNLPSGMIGSTSNCSSNATSIGYAVISGGSTNPNRPKLVRFTNGLHNGTIQVIAEWNANITNTNYMSVRVSYNPANDQWSLQCRNDGTSNFANPAAGTYGTAVTGTNNIHVNTALNFMGPYFQAGCTGVCDDPAYITRFDNINVDVACAAPSSPSYSVGPTSLCIGGTATYTASATGGTSVSYAILSGGASINSSTGVVSSVTSDFTVQATITNGCGSITVNRAVTVTTCCATTNAGNMQYEFTVQTRCSGESISANNIVSTSINAGTGAMRTVWFVGEWLAGTWGNWIESTPSAPATGAFSANLNAAVGGGNGDAQSISNYNPLIDFPNNNRFLIIRGSYNFECASWCVPSCVSTNFEVWLKPQIPPAPNLTNGGPICSGNTSSLTASGLAIQGKTATFNGTNTTMSDASYNSTTNNFTIEFWANPNATRTSTAESSSGFAGTAGGQRYVTRPWQQGGGIASSVGVSVGTNGVSVVEHDASHAPIPLVWDGTLSGWNHIAVVYSNKIPHL